MPTWCLQCGIEHNNNLAVGRDEDGEPACAMHATKSFQEINRAQRPAVQPETSKTMSNEEKLCPGVLGKPCPATKMISARKEVCGACYARGYYHMKNGAKTKREARAVAPKKAHRKPAAVPEIGLQSTLGDLQVIKAKLLTDLNAVDTVLALLGKA